MGIKNMFEKRDTLTDELKMLPRETKRRILENVNRRRSQIIEERLMSQMNTNQEPKKKTKGWGDFKAGMKSRREELKEKGIIQPIVRYNKENFRSPMEEASKRARAAEIKGIEDQRNRMKSGSMLEDTKKIKLKELKLKIPKSDSPFTHKRKANYLKDGII